METLKYTVIKTEEQYYEYCDALRSLLIRNKEEENPYIEDHIELLTLLIEKWDEDHTTFGELDPIQLLKSLMEEHRLKSKDLVSVLGASKSLVSGILNYRRGLSKENIRMLSEYFKVSQEAFNRPYSLVSPVKKQLKHARITNHKRDMGVV